MIFQVLSMGRYTVVYTDRKGRGDLFRDFPSVKEAFAFIKKLPKPLKVVGVVDNMTNRSLSGF
jgi:hypothetical protein